MTVDLLVIALGVNLDPLPIVAFILILSAKRGVLKGAGFIMGWLGSLLAVIASEHNLHPACRYAAICLDVRLHHTLVIKPDKADVTNDLARAREKYVENWQRAVEPSAVKIRPHLARDEVAVLQDPAE